MGVSVTDALRQAGSHHPIVDFIFPITACPVHIFFFISVILNKNMHKSDLVHFTPSQLSIQASLLHF